MTQSVIWKFKLRPGVNEIEMPRGAEILTAAFQQFDLMLWAQLGLVFHVFDYWTKKRARQE